MKRMRLLILVAVDNLADAENLTAAEVEEQNKRDLAAKLNQAKTVDAEVPAAEK